MNIRGGRSTGAKEGLEWERGGEYNMNVVFMYEIIKIDLDKNIKL